MGRGKKLEINHHSEFELDLAPLLAVMVKLVPVLLVSSAFVQMMIIETELPQVIQQAVKQQENNPKSATITVSMSKTEGVKITLTEGDKQKIEIIGLDSDKNVDYKALHAKFVEMKNVHPEIFKIDFNPDLDVAYKDIVRVMDEARKARNKDVKFPVTDTKTGQQTSTDYMFPEVVFSNTMDG